jgi:acyl carrier protein
MNQVNGHEPSVAELRTTIAQVLDIDESLIGETTRLGEELSLDSLMALEVMVALEKKYQVEFSESQLKQVTCLKDIHELLLSRLRERAVAAGR